MHSKNNALSLLCILAFVSLSNVSLAGRTRTTPPLLARSDSPFTAKASLIRYWNRQILLKPPIFLLSKASPLSTVDSAFLTALATQNSLSTHLHTFCSLAVLFCSFDEPSPLRLSSSTDNDDQKDADFTTYTNKRFSNYGTSRLTGTDSFKNYSVGINTPNDSFKKYSKDATAHSEAFANYANDGNVANGSFANYGFGANGGSGEFKSYDPKVNIPNLLFTTYDSDGNDHPLSFSSYSDDTNSGSQTFTSYAKHGNGVRGQFANYGHDSNTISSTFTGYDLLGAVDHVLGNDGNQTFTNYGEAGNDPHNNFKGYSSGANSATESFGNYRNRANVGKNSFQSYARNANSAKVAFTNYGKSFNPGNDTFKDYGKGSKGQTTVMFKTYSADRNFKDYVDKGVTFSGYNNFSKNADNVKVVEKGRFFRESELREGNFMVMPDIRDKMPKRPFLPRSIVSRLPFSTAEVAELKEMFHARDDSMTEHVIVNALEECERPPSRGETKRCVGSAEDMIDFAVYVLGHNITVRTTETVHGSNCKVVVGPVEGVNGGRVTESVSCHQSLYPYLLYYCHSVPNVRVYEADIIDVVSQVKINRGVAICHIDTSAWSPGHGAFVALGFGPGQIEVCHWIFENDMTWTVVD